MRSFVLFLVFPVLMMACGGSGGQKAPSPAPKPLAVESDSLTIPHRAPMFWSVTDKFGLSLIQEGEYDAESPIKPWSSWWYPITETTLFKGTDGNPSPLEKYDLYMQRVHGVTSAATSYEQENIYDPNADNWEGLCNAWAIASLMEAEPVHPATLDGIDFSVGDLKALLIKSYETVEGLKQFGQRYNGDAQSVFQDIYPDQFHRLLEVILFARKMPFIMDKDPGVAVWNTPVWKAQVRIKKDFSDSRLMHVDTWLFGASPFVPFYDFVGTLSVAFEYTYDLYGDPRPDGSLKVRFGVWTGDSVDYHPDFITLLPDKKVTSSKNRDLDVSIINEILAKASGAS